MVVNMSDSKKVRDRLEAFQAELEKLCQTHNVRLEWAKDEWVFIRSGYQADAHKYLFDFSVLDVGPYGGQEEEK